MTDLTTTGATLLIASLLVPSAFAGPKDQPSSLNDSSIYAELRKRRKKPPPAAIRLRTIPRPFQRARNSSLSTVPGVTAQRQKVARKARTFVCPKSSRHLQEHFFGC